MGQWYSRPINQPKHLDRNMLAFDIRGVRVDFQWARMFIVRMNIPELVNLSLSVNIILERKWRFYSNTAWYARIGLYNFWTGGISVIFMTLHNAWISYVHCLCYSPCRSRIVFNLTKNPITCRSLSKTWAKEMCLLPWRPFRMRLEGCNTSGRDSHTDDMLFSLWFWSFSTMPFCMET